MITKDMIIDLIQILSDRQIQVREVRRILEDGEIIATADYHRFVLDPGVHTVDQIKLVNDDLHKIVTALWTPEVIDARKKFIKDQDDARTIINTVSGK